MRQTEQSTVKISTPGQVNEKSAVKISVKFGYIELSTVKIKLTRTPGNNRGGIRCLAE
jgi:hypothetical protein